MLGHDLGDVLRSEIIDPSIAQATHRAAIRCFQQGQPQSRRGQRANHTEMRLAQAAHAGVNKQLMKFHQRLDKSVLPVPSLFDNEL